MSLPLGETPSTNAGETPANPPATPVTPPVSQGADGAEFDAARAQRTIEAQRAKERELNARIKELEPLANRAKELEEAGKSELEKAQAKAAELQQQLVTAQTAHRSALISAAVMAEATAQGANPDAIKRGTIARLVDTSAVELADDGMVKGADKAVKALLEAEPYLKATAGGTAPINGPPRSNGAAPTKEDRVQHAAERMAQSGRYGRL